MLEGEEFGATGRAIGEVCFNTAMTGYQEILTDPSYAGQIITFTFPHIGNVGTNDDDIETVDLAATPGARGVSSTPPSRSRRITAPAAISTNGSRRAASSGWPASIPGAHRLGAPRRHAQRGDRRRPRRPVRPRRPQGAGAAWPGLVGMDLVPMVTSAQRFTWDETPWRWDAGYGRQELPEFSVVAIDYGIKRNILRLLAGTGCRVTVVPATTPAEDILALRPDGVFLSNGPGDPAATGAYAVPVIRALIDAGLPTFGICLGHQMLGIALGGRTMKMHQGHHGANHPVKDLTTGKVEITSMNHGFAVDRASLPEHVTETHVSLFDGSNCGIALKGAPVFSVQYHPEASPGPRDSHYLFEPFRRPDARTEAGVMEFGPARLGLWLPLTPALSPQAGRGRGGRP